MLGVRQEKTVDCVLTIQGLPASVTDCMQCPYYSRTTSLSDGLYAVLIIQGLLASVTDCMQCPYYSRTTSLSDGPYAVSLLFKDY